MAFPHGLHLDHEGNVWTADVGRGDAPGGHVVRKFTPDGELLMTIGQSGMVGDGPGQLREPTDVVTARDGTIFIPEGHIKNGPHARIAKYAADGTFIERVGSTGQGHLQLSAPHSIAIDTEGRLFIADRDNNRLMIWDQDGNYIDQWQQFGGRAVCTSTTPTRSMSPTPSPGDRTIRAGRRGSASAARAPARCTTSGRHRVARLRSQRRRGVGVDTHGNVYGGVVRRRMLERHEAPTEQPTRGATWGPGGN